MTTSKIAMPIVDSVKATTGKKFTGNSNDYSSFDTIMNRNVQGSQKDTGKKTNSSNNSTEKSKKEYSVSDNKTSLEQNTSKNQIDTNKKAEHVVAEETINPLEEQVTVISDEIIAAMGQLEQAILTNVSEQLGISMEELSNQLQELGMTPFDLMDTNSLKQFVLNYNQAESPMDFLTNEPMTEQFQSLLETMEQIPVEDFGITKEQLTEIVQSMAEENAQPWMEQSAVNTSLLKPDKQNSQLDNPIENVQLAKDGDDETIPVSIVKEPATGEKQLSEHSSTDMQQNSNNQRDERTLSDRSEKPVNLLIQNLSKANVTNIDHANQAIDRTQMMKDIVHQIVEQIKVSIKPDSTSMEMQLNPENLGKINLTVVEKNGEMTAKFIAENHAAKEAIESQIQTLKDNLNNQGLKVEAVEVTVSDFAFRQDTQTGQGTENQNDKKSSNTSRRKIDLNTFDEGKEDVTEEEILAAKIMRDNGGSVDYTA